jgi:hypothetical protein
VTRSRWLGKDRRCKESSSGSVEQGLSLTGSVYTADTSPFTRLFRGDHALYACSDRLHPSDAGQAVVTAVIAPQLIAAFHTHGSAHPRPQDARVYDNGPY